MRLTIEFAGGHREFINEELTAEEEQIVAELLGEFAEIADQLMRKRRDYGISNIEAQGLVGIGVHTMDKSHRLFHLAGKKDPEFEKLEDTMQDLVGYGLIGLNFEKGGTGWRS